MPKKWLLLKSVYHGLLRQNRIRRLNETTEQNMEEIHHHVRVWGQGQGSIETGEGNHI